MQLCVLELMLVVIVYDIIKLSGGSCYHPGRSAGTGVSLNAGVRSNGTYPTGTTVTYHCQRGILEGDGHRRTCLSNGSWSNSHLQIKCVADPCRRWLGHKWSIASERVGNICFGLQNYLKWSDPHSIVSQCGLFTHTINRTEFDDFVKFLVNQRTVMEHFCKNWNLTYITLVMDQISPLNTDDHEKMEAIIFHCGNESKLDFMSWELIPSDQFWICIYNTTCSSPSQNENTELNLFGQSSALARYTCPKGFSIHGNELRACQQDGQWSHMAPTCQYVGCTKPLLDGNVNITFLNDSLSSGSWLEQTCDSGLLMVSGSRFRKCVNRQWDGEDALCQSMTDTNWCALSNGIGIIASITAVVIAVIWVIAGLMIWRQSCRGKHL